MNRQVSVSRYSKLGTCCTVEGKLGVNAYGNKSTLKLDTLYICFLAAVLLLMFQLSTTTAAALGGSN
jgi:hypothetical protein